MSSNKRRVDRAQRDRARRMWWDRHGAFTRGFLTGLLLAAICAGAWTYFSQLFTA